MPRTEAQKKADKKSHAKIYERIPFDVRRDDVVLNGDVIRAHATSQGETLNGFIKRAVKEAIERDKKKRIASKFA